MRGILLTVLALMGLSACSGAGGAVSVEKADYCHQMRKEAGLIMLERQSGTSKNEVLRYTEPGDPISRGWIDAAYRIPVMPTSEAQHAQIEAFGSNEFGDCLSRR